MEWVTYTDGEYRTTPQRVSLFSRAFPALALYSRFIHIVLQASSLASRGVYDDHEWGKSTLRCLQLLERTGITMEITGVDHIRRLESPCVVIANHMSTLETIILPIIVLQFRPVTFIVKESLLTYPFFGPIMRSRDPIAVTRTHPRQDLKAVLDGGRERLARGVSIVVFPQTTRTVTFDPAHFNSIGVKLAQRAGVPVVPLALLTDAWGNGKRLKEFGPVDPARDVRFSFAAPMEVHGRGAAEQQEIVRFIQERLQTWADARVARGLPRPPVCPRVCSESMESSIINT